jgi:predicted RNA-binding Zn-ribbon protein involved in translation (DUF1610 family)
MSNLWHARPPDCVHCGHVLPAAAARCPYCGSLIRVVARGRGTFGQLVSELEESTREAIELRILS